MSSAEEVLAAKKKDAEERTAALIAIFSAERNSVTLADDVVKSLSINLATAGVKPETLDLEDSELLVAAAKEGWNDMFDNKLPWSGVNAMLLTRWTRSAAAAAAAAVKGVGGDGGAGVLGSGPVRAPRSTCKAVRC